MEVEGHSHTHEPCVVRSRARWWGAAHSHRCQQTLPVAAVWNVASDRLLPTLKFAFLSSLLRRNSSFTLLPSHTMSLSHRFPMALLLALAVLLLSSSSLSVSAQHLTASVPTPAFGAVVGVNGTEWIFDVAVTAVDAAGNAVLRSGAYSILLKKSLNATTATQFNFVNNLVGPGVNVAALGLCVLFSTPPTGVGGFSGASTNLAGLLNLNAVFANGGPAAVPQQLDGAQHALRRRRAHHRDGVRGQWHCARRAPRSALIHAEPRLQHPHPQLHHVWPRVLHCGHVRVHGREPGSAQRLGGERAVPGRGRRAGRQRHRPLRAPHRSRRCSSVQPAAVAVRWVRCAADGDQPGHSAVRLQRGRVRLGRAHQHHHDPGRHASERPSRPTSPASSS